MASPISRPLADTPPETLRWLWPGYIPRGKLTMLDGDPGLGKSLIALDLAARLSTGRPFPDGSGGGPVEPTLLLLAEDRPADTVVPRLVAAGADLAEVREFVRPDGKAVRFPRHLSALERDIRSAGIGLVVIDPLIAFLSPGIWWGSDQFVRRILGPLAALAGRTGAAVLLIRHLNKMASQLALYRGGGSMGIVGTARAGLVVARDPADDDHRVLTTTKVNLCPDPRALGYRVVGTDAGAGAVEWTGPLDLTANDALRPSRAREPKAPPIGVILATEWLMAFLRGGPRTAVEVYRAAQAEGISERTLERSKGPAGVESRLIVDKATGDRQWKWRLFETPSFLPPLPFEKEEEGRW